MKRHVKYRLSIFNRLGCVNASIIFCIIPQFELAKIRLLPLHPIKQVLKPLPLWVLRREPGVLLDFNFYLFDHFLDLNAARINLLSLEQSLHGCLQFLLVDEGLGFPEVRFDEGRLDLHRLVAVRDTLLKQHQLKLSVGSVRKVDVVRLF